MIEILLKYDNMHIIGIINALNCINNHIITCINSMLSSFLKIILQRTLLNFLRTFSLTIPLALVDIFAWEHTIRFRLNKLILLLISLDLVDIDLEVSCSRIHTMHDKGQHKKPSLYACVGDGYYVAHKSITLPCIMWMFIKMKFIHCYSFI